MKPLDPLIMQVLDAYKAAAFAKDVDAFVALYDPDVCIFDAWNAWSYNGIDAWREVVAGWFDSLGSDRVIVSMERVQTVVGGDIAIAHAYIRYQGVSADGAELRSIWNRLTWALKSDGSAWKIIHEHTSAPVDIETSTVILHR